MTDPEQRLQLLTRLREPRGSRERLRVPPELKQYEDSRRFLARQMADSRHNDYDLPADAAELAGMVLRDEVVELPAATSDFYLYEAGDAAREDPLQHYDPDSGKTVKLFASAAELEAEKASLAAAAEVKGRAGRQALEELDRLKAWYDEPARSEELFHEYADVTTLARSWQGATYQLADPASRGEFQRRLMSCVRPELVPVIEDLARSYKARFDRPLPVSSVIRTQRYQRLLQRVNSNATRVDMPPHSTGMAFDISYKFMGSDEQNFLLKELARLKAEGRVEALRERSNNIHVYAFRNQPPPDETVAQYLQRVEDARLRYRGPTSPAKNRMKARRAGHAARVRAKRKPIKAPKASRVRQRRGRKSAPARQRAQASAPAGDAEQVGIGDAVERVGAGAAVTRDEHPVDTHDAGAVRRQELAPQDLSTRGQVDPVDR